MFPTIPQTPSYVSLLRSEEDRFRRLRFYKHYVPTGGVIKFRIGVIEYRIGVIEYPIGVIEYRIGVIQYRIGVIKFRIGVIQYQIGVIQYQIGFRIVKSEARLSL